MERAYTVKEIDDLRHAIELHCSPKMPEGMRSMCYYPTPQEEIERRLRTHMLAGNTAQDFDPESRDFHGCIS